MEKVLYLVPFALEIVEKKLIIITFENRNS